MVYRVSAVSILIPYHSSNCIRTISRFQTVMIPRNIIGAV